MAAVIVESNDVVGNESAAVVTHRPPLIIVSEHDTVRIIGLDEDDV